MAFGIVVIGLDHWYTAFGVLDNTHKNAKSPLVGAWDADGKRRDEIRTKYADILVPESYVDLLKRDDVQLVAVCASTDKAMDIAKAALKAGKHVLSVKPPARTLIEFDSVNAVAKASGKYYGSFEGLPRLQPKTVKLRELIQSGAIGVPLSFHHVAFGGLPQPWPGQSGMSWWLDKSKVPGGAWIDHAIYSIDLARFVFDGEVTHTSSLIENRVHKDIAVEDYGIAILRLTQKNGNSVSLLLEDTWTGGGGNRTIFIGTKGTIEPNGDGWTVKSGGQTTNIEVPPADYWQLDALVDLLTSGKTPPFTSEDSRANLAACLSVYANAPKR